MPEIETPRPQGQDRRPNSSPSPKSSRSRTPRTMRKQELMFAILKQLASARDRDHRRGRASRCCRTASASCARPMRTTCPAPTTSTSRPRRSAASACAPATSVEGQIRSPEGRRALLRPAQGQHDQFRGPGEGAPQDQLRQPDAALSRRAAEAGDRGSDQEGSLAARHRHRRADRQGPARADRGAAAHRQDGAAAEHRARRSPPTIPNAT